MDGTHVGLLLKCAYSNAGYPQTRKSDKKTVSEGLGAAACLQRGRSRRDPLMVSVDHHGVMHDYLISDP